jgi:hypothetical protein
MIIFEKFGGWQAKQDRTVPGCPPIGRAMHGINSAHSRRFIRASLCLPSRPPISDRELTMRQASSSGARPFSARRGISLQGSNRELKLLERLANHCKQRSATVSNRELWTNQYSCNLRVPVSLYSSLSHPSVRTSHSPLATSHCSTFLPGTAPKVEVTEKKRLNPVYPGPELHIDAAKFHAEFRTESQAQLEEECCSLVAPEQGKIPLHKEQEKEQL